MKSGDITPNPDSVLMTRELRRAIKAEFDRTGLNARIFMKGRRSVPVGLDARTINAWIRGQVREASAAHVNFVIDALSSIPNGSGAKSGPKPRTDEHPKIAITHDMIAELNSEMERTGASRSTLMQFEQDFPEGLTLSVISFWLNGRTKTAWADHWEFVMASFRAIPSDLAVSVRERAARNKPLYQLITDEEHVALRDHRRRTAMSGSVILKFADEKPDGLTANMIDGWIARSIKSAKAGHVAYVIKLYASIPNSDGRAKRWS